MCAGTRIAAFALALAAVVSAASPSGEDAVVEHRVGGDDALTAARRMPRHRDAEQRPGCQPCSRRELLYCSGPDVIHDHCCCDMRYYEAFPFVPHTCYLDASPCTPVAGDCEAYERLRTCCCDGLLRSRWSPASIQTPTPLLLWLLSAVLLVVQLMFLR